MDACYFCSRIQNQRVIRAGGLCVSFLSDPRLVKAHVLVIPRRHVEVPTDLGDDEISAIYSEIKRIQHRLLSSFAAGCDVWQKYQPFVPDGQIKVDHIHFHVLPRDPGDGLFMAPEKSIANAFTALDDQERDQVVGILRES